MKDEEFVKIVSECKSMAYAAKLVGMAYTTFIRKAKALNCYKPNPSGKGTHKNNSCKYNLQEILEGKHPEYQTYKLKRRLIKEGIFEDKCHNENCSSGWNKNPPKLNGYSTCELDHKNGNPTDHRLENLWLICPNCHSLTETFRFRRGKTNGVEHQKSNLLCE